MDHAPFSLCRYKCMIERKLLGGLARHNDNLIAAMEALPRNMRLLYVHAYQSLIWNSMATERFRRYGLVVVAGDLVRTTKGDPARVVCAGDKDDVPIKRVEVGDVGKYTIEDVLLPLPGYAVAYPDHDIAGLYAERLKVFLDFFWGHFFRISQPQTPTTSTRSPVPPPRTTGLSPVSRRAPRPSTRRVPRASPRTRRRVTCSSFFPSFFFLRILLSIPFLSHLDWCLKSNVAPVSPLQADGLGLDPQFFRHKQKNYSLSGGYRNVIVLPKDVEWSFERYSVRQLLSLQNHIFFSF